MNTEENQSGYGEAVVVLRESYDVLKKGELIEGPDVPLGVAFISQATILDRLPDGRLLIRYEANAC
jgi:hypothetical protein